MNPNSARLQRQKRRALGDDFEQFGEDNLDDDFLKNAGETIKASEEDQKVKKIQNQINYFGYMIEPLNMKNEREEKEIDEEGNYRFNWKREKENSDAWLSQLDDDQYGFKMYYNQNKEKGVFSDDDNDDDDNHSEEEIQQKKKIKRNDEDQVGKFDDHDEYELLKELKQILEEGQTEIYDIMDIITPRKRMEQIQSKLKKNIKPVFPFKKNIRQKEKEEQEKQIKEWESNKLSDQEEMRIKNSLEDLMDIVKNLEYKLEIATLWETNLDIIKEMFQKEEAKRQKTQKSSNDDNDEEEIAEEDDLKNVPKELLEKLNNGTITEDEEDEIKRIIMMARMRRNNKDNDSSDEELTTGRIQFDSDSDDDENDTKPLPPINKVPLSQQQNQKEQQPPQFKAPAPRRNSQSEINQKSNIPPTAPTVTMPPSNILSFQSLQGQQDIDEEEEIPTTKKVVNNQNHKSNDDEDDDIDIFG